ncbi:MAG: Uncharacterized protein XD91_1647 [Clostridiales bacterium 38_11]|nr:MAG: Uncharacterized protein XD91_1647 [Clostridiales bacterium 38_11]
MNNSKGMTLIEVVVAMAIIALIAAAVLSVFTTGFAAIKRAGNKSEAGFNAHSQIEITLNKRDTDPSPSNLTITFSSDGSAFNSLGNVETVTHTINRSDVIITFFQPKY